jgi:hypothetical protein
MVTVYLWKLRNIPYHMFFSNAIVCEISHFVVQDEPEKVKQHRKQVEELLRARDLIGHRALCW